MKTTQVIALRHGQTVWNLEGKRQGQMDSPLTEAGLSQTEKIAERLATQTLHAVYSSDLGRAHQTAMCISEKTGHRILIEPRLRERSFGIFEGFTNAEIKKKLSKEWLLYRSGGPDYVIPNGESATGFFQRCITCLEELAQNHPGERIIVVTHFGVLNCLFRHVLGIPLEAPLKFKVLEGSLNFLQFRSGRWILEPPGDVNHGLRDQAL